MKLAVQSQLPSSHRRTLIVWGVFISLLLLTGLFLAAFYLPVLFGGTVINSAWVTQFISDIDSYRASQGNSSLTPENNLTTFAEIRADNLTSHYDVPGYGFANATMEFFGSNHSQIVEIVLFPEGRSSQFMVNDIRQNSPQLWQSFLTYASYGYSIADGRYYDITNSQQCGVSTIPTGTTNTTQYLQSKNCHFTIVGSTWLIFELSK